jgi:hypothetical protein
MNIQELNNNGPQIRWFIISAASLSASVFLCWLLWLLLSFLRKEFAGWEERKGWIERGNLGQWQPSGRSHTSRTDQLKWYHLGRHLIRLMESIEIGMLGAIEYLAGTEHPKKSKRTGVASRVAAPFAWGLII